MFHFNFQNNFENQHFIENTHCISMFFSLNKFLVLISINISFFFFVFKNFIPPEPDSTGGEKQKTNKNYSVSISCPLLHNTI
jgi:hypothetical protein